MKCKNCNSNLPQNSKFCGKCGNPIIQGEEIKRNIDIEKIKKNLINTGNSVYAIGWITIIINIAIYIWSIFDSNYGESGLPTPDLSGTFLMIAASSIFIILGARIKGLVDRKIKTYLNILLILSLLILVWVVASGGRVGLLLFLIIAYLLSSLVKISKAMKVEEFTATLTNPKYKLDKKGWIIYSLALIILLIITIGVDLSGQSFGDTYSTEDLVKDTVSEIKSEMTLPDQLDEVTRIIDITAEQNAIRYHSVLTDVDTTSISNDYLKSYLGDSICQNADTKSLLQQGVDMEYSYSVDGSTQTYFVSFTESDCN